MLFQIKTDLHFESYKGFCFSVCRFLFFIKFQVTQNFTVVKWKWNSKKEFLTTANSRNVENRSWHSGVGRKNFTFTLFKWLLEFQWKLFAHSIVKNSFHNNNLPLFRSEFIFMKFRVVFQIELLFIYRHHWDVFGEGQREKNCWIINNASLPNDNKNRLFIPARNVGQFIIFPCARVRNKT